MNQRIVTLNEVAPGSVLAEAVRRSDGMLVLAEGAALTESHLERLRGLGIAEVVIAEPAIDAAETTVSIEERTQVERDKVNRLFRKSEDDRVTQALFQAVLEYRLERLK
jgi:hypothetical protein